MFTGPIKGGINVSYITPLFHYIQVIKSIIYFDRQNTKRYSVTPKTRKINKLEFKLDNKNWKPEI